jgi:YihY family inner membrane protein
MSAIDRLLRAADRFQQRRLAVALPVAVWTKFRDDRAGNLAALISYYAFAALFPLLLVLVTVLDIVLRNSPTLRSHLLTSALAQYPVIGPQIKASLGTVPGSGLPLVIGFVLLLFGARGVARAMQNAMYEVWSIDPGDRPRFPVSQLWAAALVLTIGIGFTVTTFLSGLAGGAGHVLSGVGAYVGAAAISLVFNYGVFWAGFRIATAFQVPWRNLRTGAAIAAVCWQILQVAGGYVVSHQLRRASELYGTFGIVLGLMAWLFLQAEVTLYAAEADVVLTRRLWPRSIVPVRPGQQGGSRGGPPGGAAGGPPGAEGMLVNGSPPAGSSARRGPSGNRRQGK